MSNLCMTSQRTTKNVKQRCITSQRATHYVKLLTNYVMNIPNQLDKQKWRTERSRRQKLSNKLSLYLYECNYTLTECRFLKVIYGYTIDISFITLRNGTHGAPPPSRPFYRVSRQAVYGPSHRLVTRELGHGNVMMNDVTSDVFV